MKKKLFKLATGMFAIFGILIITGGGTVGAMPLTGASASASITASTSLGLVHEQFEATGYPTSFQTDITTPPQIGQGFILEESLVNPAGTVIGSNRIVCKVVGFTPTPPTLQFACTANFNFTNGGTLKAVTTFNFDPANLPAQYDAFILSGTGIYKGALGVIHVTDPGPGNPTGYVFDFYHL